MPNRRQFLEGLAGMAGASALGKMPLSGVKAVPGAATNRLPNIVFFLVDDLGWGDFSCYGNSFHETPNIDRLAREGMKFTQAYAAAPVCSPSRAAIMTGQDPARLGLTQWIPGSKYPNKKLIEAPNAPNLPKDVPTLPEQLKKLGYQTAAIGKWHLGGDGFLPENFGFDVNVAGDNNGHPPPPHEYFGPWHFHNLTGYNQQDYLTDVLTTKMDAYLEDAARKGPFFLYMAEYAVHVPLQAPAATTAKFSRKNEGKSEPDPTYAAMIAAVDTALGNLRAKLESLGVAENTIILLTSDNGGVGFQGRNLHRVADNGPFRAGKGFLYEGGIREPLIVHWPGVTKGGSVCAVPVSGTDFLPTILSMATAASGKRAVVPQPCDGLDFTGLLRGETSLPRKEIYWHYPHYSDQGGTPTGAILQGDWKLIEFFEDGHLELYNLAVDPGEQYDFSSSFQGKAVNLRDQLLKWRQEVRALMPKPNPDYNPQLESRVEGPPGCSWEPEPGCLVD